MTCKVPAFPRLTLPKRQRESTECAGSAEMDILILEVSSRHRWRVSDRRTQQKHYGRRSPPLQPHAVLRGLVVDPIDIPRTRQLSWEGSVSHSKCQKDNEIIYLTLLGRSEKTRLKSPYPRCHVFQKRAKPLLDRSLTKCRPSDD
jgi:hypothetical protein